MESETETENYKNTSMPPSARLEENKKKEPFSSAAAGSLSAVITGTSSPECAVLAGSQSSVSQAGLNTHREARAGAARRREGQPLRGSPLGTQALGLFWRMAPRTARLALSSETHGIVPVVPRAALQLSHLTPLSLQTSPLPHCHPGPAFFPRHDLKGTEGQPRGAGLLAPCPLWPVPSPPVFVTTPPQGWATPFAGSRTTCHHSCSAPANQLPMGSPPSSPVGMSSPFSRLPIAQGEPADSSSRAPCSTHCGSLKAPWEWPLQSPSPPGLHFSASRR